mmetsp:Transcript_12714/g.35758  ORF Transcript_12714/g.35758 Transcript_12714/m.35758 type:complete len:260 (-) Transcript_12714:343-1122(-)|eukprot:CAMPEP_0117657530 /NCGR_PEP_ID=MMETSP0804-20121206/5381_1 /TAXON_ID=1074897 /ORGANISM="Tetraselmis astigmatica, Strain CCMP880" /LENGTH=259 /DNA_ID=CAMNT_0005463993 /DNA_START=47 /DNA_END=826 /DNA_ORIENTATION=+
MLPSFARREAARLVAAPFSSSALVKLVTVPAGLSSGASRSSCPVAAGVTIWRQDALQPPSWQMETRRGVSYRGFPKGTPSGSAKGKQKRKDKQAEENKQRLLKRAGVPHKLAAAGTTSTPLKGWQPSDGIVAGTPIELPDKDPSDSPLKPAEPEHSVFDQLKQLDPVLQAVALVPWLPNNQEGQKRRDYINSTLMDQLEAKGWDVRGRVLQIWEGERDLSTILDDKDSGTRAALTSIMYHCKKFDAELGDFREYARRTW